MTSHTPVTHARARTTPKRGATRPHAAPPPADASPMPNELLDARPEPEVVDVPARSVLAIDGAGGPDAAAFPLAIGALYGVTYGLKFGRKAAGRASFRVGALEGRWSAETTDARGVPPRDAWRWQLRMAIPDDVDEAELAAIVEAATHKKGGKLEGSAEARRVRLVRLPAARMGRILHVGPYADEPGSFARLDAKLAADGLVPGRAHLEIYLGDPRRVAPERLRTGLLRELG